MSIKISEPKTNHVEINIGKSTIDSSVVINGLNVSAIISRVVVDCGPASLTQITLYLTPAITHMKMDRQLLVEQLLLVGVPIEEGGRTLEDAKAESRRRLKEEKE